jgi:hypothetical protein
LDSTLLAATLAHMITKKIEEIEREKRIKGTSDEGVDNIAEWHVLDLINVAFGFFSSFFLLHFLLELHSVLPFRHLIVLLV